MTFTAMPSQTRLEANPTLGVALVLLAVAALTLAGAWFFQLVVGLQPCPMCLEQRYAYYALIPMAALLALAAANGAPRPVLTAALMLMALIAAGNAVFGVYHAGVEWKFWQGPAECTGPLVDFGKAGSLLDQLDKVKVVRCDEVQWRFLGLSLAGYNALISAAMAALAGWGAVRTRV